MSKRTKKNAKTETLATELVAPVDAVIVVEATETQVEQPVVTGPVRRARSIIPHSYKVRYAPYEDSNGDDVAAALASATKNADGKTDIAALHAVASLNGIDPTKYAHLNPGQQRMNVGNKLRTLVKTGQATYIGEATWNVAKSLDTQAA